MGHGYPQHFIEAVRNAGDIVRLISDYVPLKAGGARLKGLCPFHQEKTPSFSVDPQQQLFYCFGCQTGGDTFKFLMLYEKLSFVEAVEQLARRWGVPLPETTQRGREQEAGHERLLRMNQAALAFFQERLRSPEAGAACRGYLVERGLDDDTVVRLALGYAPESWEALRNHLAARRFAPDDLVRGGLAMPGKTGGVYDRFRDRLIFPIRDVQGHIVAFGGRAIGGGEPKYINSPDTPVYTKGDHLYGLDLAKEAIRRDGFAIVVEGYLDLAAVLRAGLPNVVASLGTAFTAQQARLLARYTGRVVFSYDADAAGGSATERSLGLLLERGFDVRVVELPPGKDPDELVRTEGADSYVERVRQAPEYVQFLIQREVRARDLGRADERAAAVNVVLPHIARIGNAIERSAWASRLADALRIEDALILQELRGAVRAARTTIRQRPPASRTLREAEALLVARLMRAEDERARFAGELEAEDLEQTAIKTIVETILALAREGGPVSAPAVLDRLADESDRDLLTRILVRDEPDQGPTIDDCLVALRRKRLARERSQLRRELGGLEPGSSAAPAEVDAYLARLQELARQRDALS